MHLYTIFSTPIIYTYYIYLSIFELLKNKYDTHQVIYK